MTYTELDDRAGQVARWLSDVGVSRGDRVVVLAHLVRCQQIVCSLHPRFLHSCGIASPSAFSFPDSGGFATICSTEYL